MNTDELRDLFDARTAPAVNRPVPPAFQHRLRRARRTRTATVCGAAVLAVAGVAALVPALAPDEGPLVRPGTSPSVPPPPATTTSAAPPSGPIDEFQEASRQATYWWNQQAATAAQIAWPREKKATLTFTPNGEANAVAASCDGFESNVNVTMTLSQGATWLPEYGGGRETGFNCFSRAIFGVNVKAGIRSVTLTIVAASYGTKSTPKWPVSRPRTWLFAAYTRAEKADPDTEFSQDGMPERLIAADEREVMDILNNRHTP